MPRHSLNQGIVSRNCGTSTKYRQVVSSPGALGLDGDCGGHVGPVIVPLRGNVMAPADVMNGLSPLAPNGRTVTWRYGTVWPAPAVTAVTLSWWAAETAQPVTLKGSSVAWVWFGGYTFSLAAVAGLHAAAG